MHRITLMYKLLTIFRVCPNCKQKCIKPLQFRLLQSYYCEKCHKRIKTPRWFTILTVFLFIVLYFTCLEFNKDGNIVLATLIIYLLFETQINALFAPLIVSKKIN